MNEQQEKVKKISVSIGGVSYQLVSQENEAYTREIAKKADEAIRQIAQQHPSLSAMQATVLAIVNAFDALTKLNDSLEESKKAVEKVETAAAKEIDSIKFKMTKAQHELFALRDADFELKKEFLRINELNKQLELEIAFLRQKQSTNPIRSQTFGIDPSTDGSDPHNQSKEKGIPSNEPEETARDDQDYSEDPEDRIEQQEFNEESDPLDESEILADLEEQPDSLRQSGLDDIADPFQQADLDNLADSFFDELQNPFTVPMDCANDPVSPDDTFQGYKQPSLEDLFP